MPRVFVYIAVVSVLTCTARAQQVNTSATEDRISDEPRKSGPSENNVYKDLFRKSFSVQRKEHAVAVRHLKKIDSYERLYKMITILGEKMMDVIEASKSLIEAAGFDPDDRSLPQNVTVQSAISTVLENTALFGDIVLHFPHVAHRILKSQRKWYTMINWTMDFANRSSHFLDKETNTMLDLLAQELNMKEREPGYFNPYWRPADPRQRDKDDESRTKKAKRKEKRKRGPQMTKIEL